MRFLNVFLAAFLIMSCNDSDKKEIVDSSKSPDEVVDADQKDNDEKGSFQKDLACSSWGATKWKLNGNEETDSSGEFSATKDGKLSLKLSPIKEDGSGIDKSGNLEVLAANTPYTYADNKITFEKKDGNKMEIIVKKFDGNDMTWEIKSKVPGKDFVREIKWHCQ